MEQTILSVQGMSCHHCKMTIEGNVGKLAGVSQVKVNLRDANVDVAFNPAVVKIEQIKEVILDSGYEVA